MGKVGIFTDHTGGVFAFSARLSYELKKRSHDVHILSYNASSDNEKQALNALSSASNSLHLISKSEDDANVIDNIYSVLEHSQFDVFIPNYRSTTYAAYAKYSRNGNTRCIGICHDNDESYYNLLNHYESVIDAISCPAQTIEIELKSKLPHRENNIYYMPHGIPDFTNYHPRYESGHLFLEYHGRLEEAQKRISYLIELARELKKRKLPYTLYIIGNGPDVEKYKSHAHDLGLLSEIIFFGQTEWQAVMDILAKCHLSLLVSKHEGFCYSLAEAMGIGLPGIAFSCGGIIEQYLKNDINGFVVPWGDVQAMADKVVMFYNNSAMWRSFSEQAKREIHVNYSLEQFGVNYAELIHSLIDNKLKYRTWPKLRPIFTEGDRLRDAIETAGKIFHIW